MFWEPRASSAPTAPWALDQWLCITMRVAACPHPSLGVIYTRTCGMQPSRDGQEEQQDPNPPAAQGLASKTTDSRGHGSPQAASWHHTLRSEREEYVGWESALPATCHTHSTASKPCTHLFSPPNPGSSHPRWRIHPSKDTEQDQELKDPTPATVPSSSHQNLGPLFRTPNAFHLATQLLCSLFSQSTWSLVYFKPSPGSRVG